MGPLLPRLFRRDPLLLASHVGPRGILRALAASLLGAILSTSIVLAIVLGLPDVSPSLQWLSGDPLEQLHPGNLQAYALILIAFVPWTLGFMVAWQAVMRRPQHELFGWIHPFPWGDLVRAAAASLIASFLFFAVWWMLYPHTMVLQPHWPAGLAWLAVGAGVIFVQASCEEIVFRGFLVRVWGVILPIRALLVALIIGIFVALHVPNEDVQRDLGFILIWFVIGEIAMWFMLFRTKSLAAPIGLHWMNNVLAIFIVTTMPGGRPEAALIAYHDPVLLAGGSRLTDVASHALAFAGLVIMLVLLLVPGSPFRVPYRGLTAAPPAAGQPERAAL